MPLDDPAFKKIADRYFAVAGTGTCWLSYHLRPGQESEFGRQLLSALADCERQLEGLGLTLASDLANIAYTPAASDAAAWTDGFQQLLQKLTEVLVLRVLVTAGWPAGTSLHHEPTNPRNGKRPELVVDTPDRLFLFEVKCPSLVAHQRRRSENPRQIPARTAFADALRAEGTAEATTWPRDNTLKDFLDSAEEKFSGFANKPTTGILVVAWDAHMYEPISALTHAESGLLTEASFHKREGIRVTYPSVDGVVVLNHLAVLDAAAQEQQRDRRPDAFAFGEDPLPNVWCANIGGSALPHHLLEALDAVPVAATANFADYTPKDLVFWFDPGKRQRQARAADWKRSLFDGGAGAW